MDVVAKNLKKIRQTKGWTQEKLARSVHIDRTTYTKYETGRADPSLDMCICLCRVLKITPDDLFGWEAEEE